MKRCIHIRVVSAIPIPDPAHSRSDCLQASADADQARRMQLRTLSDSIEGVRAIDPEVREVASGNEVAVFA